MNKPHQHFIPQTYLKNFAHTQNGETFLVDAFNKLSGEAKNDMSITDVCVETDLYTLKGLRGDDKYKIENYFSEKIETNYPSIYKLLVQDKKKVITNRERIPILYTTLSMYFRTPKVLNQFAHFAAQLIDQVITEKETDTIDFAGYQIDVKGKPFAKIRKEIKETHRIDYIKTQLCLLDEFIRFKALDGFVIIELFGEQEFITSDNPVEIRNAATKVFNLFDINNSTYIPLDSKHALFIAPKVEGATPNRIFYQRDNFFQHVILNHCVYQNAERWIVGTRIGIEKFFRNEEQYGKPINDDHPIIIQAETKLKLMQEILSIVEKKGVSNQNMELISSLIALRQHELYSKSIEFQDLYNGMKDIGLNIP